jgi:hypothetical protein
VTTPLHYKRGETLRIMMTLTSDDGAALDLTTYTLASKARTSGDATDGAPLATATITKDNQATNPGRIFVDFGETDSTWPIGRVSIDVRYESASGDVRFTPTFSVDIERAIT